MNWLVTDGFVGDGQGRLEEGQTVEFKASLSEQDDATQSAVAFANAQGGRIFFGVNDDGSVCGVDVGQNTQENLANNFKAKTYPTLPVTVESIETEDAKRVIVVDAPRDVPPLVGVYLYSPTHISTGQSVSCDGLRAYRRVGKTDRREDFMSLRGALPSEPRVVMYLNGAGGTAGAPFPRRQDFYYTNSGVGWAFNVAFHARHTFYELSASPEGISLPPFEQEDPSHRTNRRRGTVEVLNPMENGPVDEPAILVAVYTDEHGLTWESRLELLAMAREGSGPLIRDFTQGRFSRQITVLPPK